MEHHGTKLRGIAKAQGFDIQGIANALGQHRVTVEKDFKAPKLTQKVLNKYSKVLELTIEDFYPKVNKQTGVSTNTSSDSIVIELYKKLLQEKDERIKLLENQVRFFPNAAQLV